MDTQQQPKEQKKADPLDTDRMKELIGLLKDSMEGNLEDVEQQNLIRMVQKNRAFVLEFAMAAWLDNPKNAHLLEGVNQILQQIEKVVRDDRKEALKKKENENNQISFNQMMEAMQKLNQSGNNLPTFNFGDFILDPTKPIAPSKEFFNPINEHELQQGNQLVDLEGNPL